MDELGFIDCEQAALQLAAVSSLDKQMNDIQIRFVFLFADCF